MKSEPIKLGSRFGRLTVIEQSCEYKRCYVCRCSCGKRTAVLQNDLRNGHVRSCGCLLKDIRRTCSLKHGKCRIRQRSPEYTAYHFARQACRTKGSKYFARFGGRGIQFEFSNFIEFYKCVGDRPGPDCRLERIDKDGDFEAGNLQWIPRKRRTRVRK
jgi:hypothetical protein